MIYPVVILKQAESNHIALAPDWPNLRGNGTSIEDALLSVQEAIAAKVKEHIESQTPTPTPRTIEEACREKEYQGGIWAMIEADRVYSAVRHKRLNITLSEQLVDKLDRYASEHGLTRSGLLAIAALDYMKRNNAD